MNLNYITDSLYLFKPEIAISITLVLVVTVDLIMSKNKKLLPYISLLGLLVAAYFVIAQFDYNTFASVSSGNKGLISVDAFGAFFKMLVLLASFLVVIFSLSSNEIKKVFY